MSLIHRAVPADFSALDELVREFYAIDGHHYAEKAVADALAPLLGGDDFGEVLLFDSGYAVVTWGYSIESGGRHALLDEFYVRNRGRGVGGKVIEEICARYATLGISRMILETERHNDRARAFYTRHGFRAEQSTWFSRTAR